MDLVTGVAVTIVLTVVAQMLGFPALDWFTAAVGWVMGWAEHLAAAVQSRGSQ
jgi:hypothetical protein